MVDLRQLSKQQRMVTTEPDCMLSVTMIRVEEQVGQGNNTAGGV